MPELFFLAYYYGRIDRAIQVAAAGAQFTLFDRLKNFREGRRRQKKNLEKENTQKHFLLPLRFKNLKKHARSLFLLSLRRISSGLPPHFAQRRSFTAQVCLNVMVLFFLTLGDLPPPEQLLQQRVWQLPLQVLPHRQTRQHQQPSSCSEQNQTAAASVRPSIWSERLSDCVVVKERKGGASPSPHSAFLLDPQSSSVQRERSSSSFIHPPTLKFPPTSFPARRSGGSREACKPAKRGGKHVRPLLARGGREGSRGREGGEGPSKD